MDYENNVYKWFYLKMQIIIVLFHSEGLAHPLIFPLKKVNQKITNF